MFAFNLVRFRSLARPARTLLSMIGAALLGSSVLAQMATMTVPVERPPAAPLIAHNPYFSVWSTADKLTDGGTVHWTGHPQGIDSLVRIDGKTYRVMGQNVAPALEQKSEEVTFTHTRYLFANSVVEITLTFFTPAFLEDMDLLSRPVTYLTWQARSLDGSQHDVSVLLTVSPEIATSYEHQPVVFSRNQTAQTNVLSVGTQQQDVLNRSGDDLRIDWGYFHVAVPKDEASTTAIASDTERSWAENDTLPAADAMDGPVATDRFASRIAVALPLGSVGAQPIAKHVLVSYTEGYAFQYFHQNLRPWWQRDGKTVAAMLDEAAQQYAALEMRGVAFDRDLKADLSRSAGEHYAYLCALAYRHSIAAHILVAGPDGSPMLFAKENFSNGDTATVDVLYPSSPIFLFFNPKLLQAQVLPVLQYAAMANRWHFPFAPHDLGQYPLANGQEYGGGEKTEENQMPVEESGNLLILVDALAQLDNNTVLAEKFWPQLTQWAEYLWRKGLDPENQLSTDDFAGHLAHNSNLSIKAIDALAAYADLAKTLHHDAEAKRYQALALKMAKQWIDLAKEDDHYKLAFDRPGTWSQKYNLVWDKVLDYALFPKSIREQEVAFYRTKLNRYGLPLDSRKEYTKLDWEMWTATLADTPEAFNDLVDHMYLWANETQSRVPLTDWYDTITGLKQPGFQARSVVGGLFMKALNDRKLAVRWREKGSLMRTMQAQHSNTPHSLIELNPKF